MLDACKEIGDRMLSAICTTIPEWKNAQADVAEIRGDIVCTFKNVESIFNDLLKLYRNGQFNGVASVRAACLFHAWSSSSSLQQSVYELFRLCMGYSGVTSVENQVASVTEVIRKCLQPYQLKSLSDLFVGSGGWTEG